MAKFLAAFFIALLVNQNVIAQQRQLQPQQRSLRPRPNASSASASAGATWEYKVIDRKTKQTKITGRLQVEKAAIYAVGKPKIVEKVSTDDDVAAEDEKESPTAKTRDRSSSIEARRNKGRSRGRTQHAKEDKVKPKQVGEVVISKKKARDPNKSTFRFSKDDDYILSGVVVLNRDKKAREVSLWVGSYTDEKKKRWKFEMKKQGRAEAQDKVNE